MRPARFARWAWLLAATGVVTVLVMTRGHAPPAGIRAPASTGRVAIGQAPSREPAVAAGHALPLANAPLSSNRQPLQEAAEEGDAAAASRLFNDMAWCIERPRMELWLAGRSSDPATSVTAQVPAPAEGADQRSSEQSTRASIERNAQRVVDTRQMCEGTEAMRTDGSIYEAMLLAARLGDTAASACALVAPYPGPRLTPAQAGAYADETRRHAEAALQKGSWANAFALADISARQFSDGGEEDGYGVYTDRPDPAMQLRYWALLRHGMADGTADAKTFDGGIAALSAQVTPAQRNEALRWADETFARYFAMSGPARAEMTLCED